MAPKLKIPQTLAAAGNQSISSFFPVKKKPGRPKKAMMETTEETDKAATVLTRWRY
jgi:hypothetical protein